MMPDAYLKAVLESQTLADDSEELEQLESRREEVEKLLREKLAESSLTIRYGGSKAKGTLILDSYDLDLICYLASDDVSAGETLEDIYDNVCDALKPTYRVTRKTSALRLRGGDDVDFHVDVVPGRFTDETKGDAYLHRTTGDKKRLKTNLDVHIEHVKDSGLTDAIRLMKLWRERNAVAIRTFPLELVTIEVLEGMDGDGLSKQLEHLLTELRDNADDIKIEDPANPTGNDLSELWSEGVRREVGAIAKGTLETVAESGWEGVFGSLDDDSGDDDERAAARRVARSVSTPSKPWCMAA